MKPQTESCKQPPATEQEWTPEKLSTDQPPTTDDIDPKFLWPEESHPPFYLIVKDETAPMGVRGVKVSPEISIKHNHLLREAIRRSKSAPATEREILREIYVRYQNKRIDLPVDLCGMIVNAIGVGTEPPVTDTATQEWTPQTVHDMMITTTGENQFDQRIADAHNAALAAERKRVKKLADEWWGMAEQAHDDKWRKRFEQFGKIVMKEKETAIKTHEQAWVKVLHNIADEYADDMLKAKFELDAVVDAATNYMNELERWYPETAKGVYAIALKDALSNRDAKTDRASQET